MRKTNENDDSCYSCKRLRTSCLHELHESKFSFVFRIEFIRSKLSNFSAHVSGVNDASPDLIGGGGGGVTASDRAAASPGGVTCGVRSADGHRDGA